MVSARRYPYTQIMSNRSNFSFSESLTGDCRRRFYEEHRSVAIAMILVVFVAPFAGLYVTGLLGVVLGVVLSVGAYYFIPYLWLKLGD